MRNFHTRFDDAHAERLVDHLDNHPDYHVLRRLLRLREMWLHPTPAGGPHTTLAVVDAETTGLYPDSDAMIELAVVRMGLDRDGNLVEITAPLSMLEHSGRPVPNDILGLAGIDASQLDRRRFDDAAFAKAIGGADVMVSHNAAFDRRSSRDASTGSISPWPARSRIWIGNDTVWKDARWGICWRARAWDSRVRHGLGTPRHRQRLVNT